LSSVDPAADERVVALQEAIYRSRNPTRRELHGVRQRWLRDAAARYLPELGDLAVEVGIGSGVNLAWLVDRAARTIGIDIDVRHLEAVRQNSASWPSVPEFVHAPIDRLPLPDGSVDLLVCSEVVEHVADDRGAYLELARVLSPRGVLLLTTPQRYSMLELVARLALSPPVIGLTRALYREPVEPLGHVNLMTSAALAEKLRAAGLEVMERRLVGLYLPVIAEIGGEFGARLSAKLAGAAEGSVLEGLLWTQCYVLRRFRQGSPP
jgi:ubiquinone/menaquinone biosynthesis C-methylase UbiE